MNVKRQKKVKKNLQFYQRNFGFKPPYTVLVDGQFCSHALTAKVNLLEQLPKYLDAPVKIVTTKCIIKECENLRQKIGIGPLKVLEQYEVVPCKHKKAKIVPICLMRFARQQDKMKCMIATQDEQVNAEIRKLIGVPFLTFVHGTMILQAPSTASHQEAQRILSRSLQLSEHEMAMSRELKRQAFGEPAAPVPTKKRKRKGPKEPNPLSCLKKKKKPNQPPTNKPNTTSDGEPAKKKRTRIRKRKWGKDNSQE